MNQYILRLDDASDHMDLIKWKRIEELLDKYNIKPIFGIIPKNEDKSLVDKYGKNDCFWELMHSWIEKGWIPAMHGYEHKYVTEDGGINPVNKRSEFAGLPYEIQADKIKKGYDILYKNNIKPKIFFAPSHTFDLNTLKAIKDTTDIRYISDTIAWDVYKEGVFFFIPQQSGNVRKLPFKVVTFCYHPNTMNEESFVLLEKFITNNLNHFVEVSYIMNNRYVRKKRMIDYILEKLYFLRRKK